MNGVLEGKTAVVTGAAKGIGRAVAEALSAAGAHVVAVDIDGDGAAATAAALASATAKQCDVRDEAAVGRLFDEVVAERSRVDVLVAAAGVARVGPLVGMSLADWHSVLSVDLDGVFLCATRAAAAMSTTGGGSIITIASIKAFGGSPAIGHYGAAKAGVVSLTKTLALEMRDHGIRANAICPGWIGTDMVFDRTAELESARRRHGRGDRPPAGSARRACRDRAAGGVPRLRSLVVLFRRHLRRRRWRHRVPGLTPIPSSPKGPPIWQPSTP
ncbi:SDR family NAD(P)-dependent oxidoreductase [Tsukamurella soli]